MVDVQTGTQSPGSAGLAWHRQLTNAILDLFFPPRCGGCGNFGAWLCDRCLARIERICPPVCGLCGLPLRSSLPGETGSGGSPPRCGSCGGVPSDLDGMRASAFFAGPLREAIHQLKYSGVTVLAGPLARLMALSWRDLAPEGQDVEIIVPVPLHPMRERERGYNQAALLARELGPLLRRPVVEDVLRRPRATAPQVSLSPRERYANVRGAFRCADSRLRGRRVLLVDDVCTTGATLEAAAAALRLGGASAVVAYTLARAR